MLSSSTRRRFMTEVKKIRLVEVLSGIINGLLMFIFSCVFSTMIFDGPQLEKFIPIGVGINTVGVFLTGVLYAFYSQCIISISGPDINPTVFFATMAQIIVTSVDVEANPEEVLPTILMCISFSTFIVGIFLFVLGHFRLTRIVLFIPVSVLGGFLAAVGYMVMEKGIKVAVGEKEYNSDFYKSTRFWYLLAPALPIGVGLYVFKRLHIANSMVLFPCFLVIPLVIFYLILLMLDKTVAEARADGWFFEEFDDTSFYQQWKSSFGSLDLVNWHAFGKTIPTLMVMLLVVSIAFLLQLAATRKSLKLHSLEFPYEVQLAGIGNVLLSFFVGAPAHSQVKFNLLNYNIIHNVTSNVPGLITALFNGTLWFVGFPLVNFLPRFFLAGLIFYSGLGFVVENLWDSRKSLTKKEYLTVWVIMICNAIWELLVAVLVGIVLAAIIFAIQYGRHGVVKAVVNGSDYQSSVVRSEQEDRKLEHICSLATVIQLQRYIFFGSANQVRQLVTGIVDNEIATKEKSSRIQTIIFDWEDVDGIDFTATAVFLELIEFLLDNTLEVEPKSMKLVATPGTKPGSHRKFSFSSVTNETAKLVNDELKLDVLFAGMNQKVFKKMENEGVLVLIGAENCFQNLDLAMEYVEESMLEKASQVRARWLVFDSFKRLHEVARLKAQYEPFEHVLGGHLGDQLWKYIEPLTVPKGWTICRAGHINPHLYLLQHGRLTSYMERNDGSLVRLQTMRRGAFVNEDAIFIEMPNTHTIVAEVDSIVLALSREHLKEIEAFHPEIAFEIHRNVLRHTAHTRNKLARELDAVDHWLSHTKQIVQSEKHSNNKPINTRALRAESLVMMLTAEDDEDLLQPHQKQEKADRRSRHSLNSSPPRGISANAPSPSYLSPSELYRQVSTDSKLKRVKRQSGASGITAVSSITSPNGVDERDGVSGAAALSTAQRIKRQLSYSLVNNMSKKSFWSVAGSLTNSKKSQTNLNLNGSHHGSGPARSRSRRMSKNDVSEVILALDFQQDLESSKTSKSSRGSPTHIRRQNSRGSPTHIRRHLSQESMPRMRRHPSNESVACFDHFIDIDAHEGIGPLTTISDDNVPNSLATNDEFEGDTNSYASSQSSVEVWENTFRTDLHYFRHVHLDSDLEPTTTRTIDIIKEMDLPKVSDADSATESAGASTVFTESRAQEQDAEPEIQVDLSLSHFQKANAVACYNRAIKKKARHQHHHRRTGRYSKKLESTNSSQFMMEPEVLLPSAKLTQTLMDMGIFTDQSELEELLKNFRESQSEIESTNQNSEFVDLEEFLFLVKSLTLTQLKQSTLRQFSKVFVKFATLKDPYDASVEKLDLDKLFDLRLTIEELDALMHYFGHGEDKYRLRRLFQEWSVKEKDRGRLMNFNLFCSMMANFIKLEQLDEEVERDFVRFSGDDENYHLVTAEDIMRVLKETDHRISLEEAQEMVFEADVAGKGGVSFEDFVDTITTVFDSEIDVQLQQMTHDLHQTKQGQSAQPINHLSKHQVDEMPVSVDDFRLDPIV